MATTTFTASTLTARDLIEFVTDAYAADTAELAAEFGESEDDIAKAAKTAGLVSTTQGGETIWQSPFGEDADDHLTALAIDADKPILGLTPAPLVKRDSAAIADLMGKLAPAEGEPAAPAVSVPAADLVAAASAEEQREAREYISSRSRVHHCRMSRIAKDLMSKVIRPSEGKTLSVKAVHEAWKASGSYYTLSYGLTRKLLNALAADGRWGLTRRGGGKGGKWKYAYSPADDKFKPAE